MSGMMFINFVVLSVDEVCADYSGVNVCSCLWCWCLSQCLWCSLCGCMLFVSYVWVWVVVIFVLSVMRVVGGVPL